VLFRRQLSGGKPQGGAEAAPPPSSAGGAEDGDQDDSGAQEEGEGEDGEQEEEGEQEENGEQEAGEGEDEEAGAGEDEEESSGGGEGAGEENGSEAGSGMLSVKVQNQQIVPVTPLRRYFDIVWLPDFEEKYVLRTKAGLGNASVTMVTGQGWRLEGLEASLDNSALNDQIFGIIDSATEILSQAAKLKLGIVAPETGAEGGPEGGPEGEENIPEKLAGTRVTAKVSIVRLASPGLYPVLKPAEVKEAKPLPCDEADRILVPIYPYTNIAFNTYQTMVVEVASPAGDSPLRMHQVRENEISQTEPRDGTDSRLSPPPSPSLLEQAREEINGRLGPPNAPHWELESLELRLDGECISGTARKKGGNPSKTLEDVKKVVEEVLGTIPAKLCEHGLSEAQ
jgi:hypothetical protein